MARTTKKGSNNKKATLRRPVVKTSVAEQAQTNAELRQQLAKSLQREEETKRQLNEALEQQTATNDILDIIASSAAALQSVLDAVIANAVKLSGATKGHLRLIDGDFLQVVAHFNETPQQIEMLRANPHPLSRSVSIREARPVHRHDLREREPIPGATNILDVRTQLAVPLISRGSAIGNIMIWHDVVKPFTDSQIDLVKSFANQAVIAIENARLVRQLTESLEQQTATSEILGVIASSPQDIQPVLETVAATAARLCEATDAQIHFTEGDGTRLVAAFGPLPAPKYVSLSRKTPAMRAIIERRAVHVHDLRAAETEYPDSQEMSQRFGTRTFLSVPLLREGLAIGSINIRRTEVRPFSEKQIALLKTFADQAVIAIENVRLFKELGERNAELREALEHQTATAEVLEHHQPLAYRRAAGPRRHRRERGKGLWHR